MSYQLHQTDGIVLRRWPRGEGDAVLHLYTKDYGGIMLLAKGIRLEKSKLRGAVDLFSQANIGFIAGKETYRLTHAEARDGHARLQGDHVRYRAAGSIADLFCRTVADGEADFKLWQLLEETFSYLFGDAFQEKTAAYCLRSFEIKFLKQLGYLPEAMPHVARAMETAPTHSFIGSLSSKEAEELSLFLQPLLQYATTTRIRTIDLSLNKF